MITIKQAYEDKNYFPKREWVGLTDEEIWECNVEDTDCAHICGAYQNILDFAKAIQAKLKEKNA